MTTPAPTVTDHDDFERQLLELRKREKAHTREGDAIAAARRRLPMTEVPPDTTVIGPDGPVPFGDVFEGRDELVVYSHMFHDGKPWEWQCEGCTRNSWNMGHAADAAYLNANGITFAILGDGPYEEIAAFRDFMGYTVPWYSIAHLDDPTVGVAGRISCYLRREDKTLFVATHDLSCVAANFDHAVLLNRRVVAFGRPAEVFTEELLSAAFQRHLLVLPGGERTLVGP